MAAMADSLFKISLGPLYSSGVRESKTHHTLVNGAFFSNRLLCVPEKACPPKIPTNNGGM